MKKFTNNPILILDGAIGTEIQRRGITMHPCAWTATSHIEHSNVVQQIHIDYINAGSDVVTTNTFSTAYHLLDQIGLGHAFEEINRKAVNVAKSAKEITRANSVLIAGSISTIPDLENPDTIEVSEFQYKKYREQAQILVDEGVDVLLAEMMLYTEATNMIVDACTGLGVPIWVGLSASRNVTDNNLCAFRTPKAYCHLPNESFEYLVKQVARSDIDILGVMHTDIKLIPSALETISSNWGREIMAYAQLGSFNTHDWNFDDVLTPQQYLSQVKPWTEFSRLKIVGGCCGTTPDHIRMLKTIL